MDAILTSDTMRKLSRFVIANKHKPIAISAPRTEEAPASPVSLYTLTEPMFYRYRCRVVLVEAGTVSNAASVPPLLWSLVPPTGLILRWSFAHDAGYGACGVIRVCRCRGASVMLLRERVSRSWLDAMLRDGYRTEVREWLAAQNDADANLPRCVRWLRRAWRQRERARPWLTWAGVRCFGGVVWRRYARAD